MALFMVMFLAGWNDASQGPLLPSLQIFYNLDYLVISIIWVFNFLGFMSSGLTNVWLTDRLGFGVVAPLGAAFQALGYVWLCWGAPYPVFVLGYVFVGYGLGLQDAQVNSLTSRLPGASTKMFLMHAVYGLGATVSPLVSTEFVKRVPRIYLYFTVSLGLAIITLVVLALVFRGRTEDQVVGVRPDVEKSASGGKMKRILTTPVVHYMAIYICIYVGVEVTIGGWAVSFILNERGGNSNAGYISVGYFGGLTLGRVILIPLTLDAYHSSIVAIALEVVVWLVHSIPANAACFALIGFILGPMYPIVMMVVVDVIPGELQGGTIGWIASLGQAGSAMMPFITGALANHYGVWILQPLIIAFLGFSLVLWFFVPRPKGWRA
ncbi:major facilitator superfamily domain-containing protein [Naematelia encephala]|uniref:Major facilitator superfamily domain-containing protein n=1 Tax=Naematelia encephala TaxID=71784 RepID=A0A1Y2AWJ5_9TREE|nr:major facilitator superfamily domain-containing protein [Naematelia encephala]